MKKKNIYILINKIKNKELEKINKNKNNYFLVLNANNYDTTINLRTINLLDKINVSFYEKSLKYLEKLEINIKKNKYFKNFPEYFKEEILNTFTLQVSPVIFLREVLNLDNCIFYIHNGYTWKKFDDNDKLVSNLSKIYDRFFDIKINYFSFFHNKIVEFMINKIIKFIIGNKKIIIVTDDFEKSDRINKYITFFSNKFIFVKFKESRNNLLSLLFDLKNYYFNKTKIINLPLINLKNKFKYKNEISKFIDSVFNNFEIKYKKILKRRFLYSLNNLEILKNHFNLFYVSNNVSLLIAHHLFWSTPLALGYISNINKVPVILITHGTHTYQKDYFSRLVNNFRSKGMIYSKYATFTIAQSKLANDYLINKNYNIKIIKTKPLMWGKIYFSYQKYTDIFTILHASTFKLLNARFYMYENSIEYYLGIVKLIKIVNKIKNIKLIIRPINNIDFDKNILNKYLNEKITIDKNKNFIDSMNQSDMLISNSSTTIEQSLYLRKPVGLHSYGNNYFHINGSLKMPDNYKRYPVYQLNDNNINDMLVNIQKYHHNKKLNNSEVSGLIWTDKFESIKQLNKYLN